MTRLADLRELASSRLFLFLVENVEGEISNSFTLSFFLVALASIVISLFAGKKEGRSEIKLILVLYAILLMLTCFVPSKHRSEQVLILIPFVEIVIGIFIGLLWKYLGNSLRSALIIALLLGPVVYSEIDIIQAQYKEIKNNRICKVFAPSVFTHAEALMLLYGVETAKSVMWFIACHTLPVDSIFMEVVSNPDI